MWKLIFRVAGQAPKEFLLKPGNTTIGRGRDVGIHIGDLSASREHALINVDEENNVATIRDLESTNGTYVNQGLLEALHQLQNGERIRIGSTLIVVKNLALEDSVKKPSNEVKYTRELLLQAVDYHAVLMYEVAEQLNNVVDLDEALQKLSSLMKTAMGADKCVVVLAKQFDSLSEIEIPTTIALKVIQSKIAIITPDHSGKDGVKRKSGSALLMRVQSALCVPVMLKDDLVGIIYLDKRKASARKFDRDDLNLAIAISHQAALTIHRMNLMEQLHEESKIQQVLKRFVSPQETDVLLKNFMLDGQLPGLSNGYATILFADLVNSTGLAEKLGPIKFGELLDKYYSELTEIIFRNKGIVRYYGDGVLATFLSEEDLEQSSKIAVRAGFEIQSYSEKAPDNFNVIVTITSGEVVAGYVGNAERVEFTVLGDPVNVAYGMQKFARPNCLLVGKEVIDTLGIHGSKKIHPLEPIKVKKRRRLVEVFEICR